MAAIRCSRCMKGPFKVSDLDVLIYEYGDKKNPIRYCKMCASQLRLPMSPVDTSLIYNKTNHGKSGIKKEKIKKEVKINMAEDIVTSKKKIKVLKDLTPKYSNILDIYDNQLKYTDDIPRIVSGKHSVYVVKCLDGTLFCGITKDIKKSIKYMNSGSGNKYTRPKTRRPVTLIYMNQVNDLKSANVKRTELKNKLTI